METIEVKTGVGGGLPPISTLTSMLAKLGVVCVSSLAAFQARDTSKSTPRGTD